tara:strand:- start:822 stop:2213 length:1392 start_codon:yes stop_codon:yes gene_type:complete
MKTNFRVLTFLIILFFISSILYGGLLRYHYYGGENFYKLRTIAVFFAEIPFNLKYIIENRTILGDKPIPISNKPQIKKKFFNKIKDNSREELILISRHDGDIGRSVVEIRDLKNFSLLHTYKPNIEDIYKKIDLKEDEFQYLKRDLGYNKFYMGHPAITSKGELIFQSVSPLVKIDFNSKIIWVKDDDLYHHSTNFDEEENIYVPSYKNPYSKKVAEIIDVPDERGVWDFTKRHMYFYDDAINILDKNGKTLFSKSVSEIFIENGLKNRIFAQQSYKLDPIHLNDIEPVLFDGPHFKKGDLFLSLRSLSMIVLYRPSTNKLIKVIEGDFYQQHDVDILDEKTISIYNNNALYNSRGEMKVINNVNEVTIFDLEKNSFSKKFENTFAKLRVNSNTNGLIDFLDDSSAIVEDRNNGRIFYLNKDGEVIWEFNNLNSKKILYNLWWSRIIDINKSNLLKKTIEEKK